jgi:hypothetical protein
LVVVMGLMLAAHSGKLGAAYEAAQAECGRNKVLASAQPARLEQEKRDLTQKSEVIHKFLDSRILWTTYTRDIAARLPANTHLTQFEGLYPLEDGRKKGAVQRKKSLLVQAQSTLMPDGSVPREVGDFLVSLRSHPLLKRDFPDIRLANIKPAQFRDNKATAANFTILCQPNSSNAPKSGSGGGEKKKETK